MTIIREGKYNNTGNFVADYGWYEEICDFCKGDGWFEFNRQEAIEYLLKYWSTREKFLSFVKDNIIERNGNIYKIRCQECGGRGKWSGLY